MKPIVPPGSTGPMGLGTMIPAPKWTIGDFRPPWGQLKYNLPDMYTKTTRYVGNLYEKMRHILAGQGMTDPANPPTVLETQKWWKAIAVCVQQMQMDTSIDPEAYPIIRDWYTNVVSNANSGGGSSTPGDRLAFMMNSFSDLHDRIKGKTWEPVVANKLERCFSEALPYLQDGTPNPTPTPGPMPLAASSYYSSHSSRRIDGYGDMLLI